MTGESRDSLANDPTPNHRRQGGNSRAYTLDRLEREAPALFERVAGIAISVSISVVVRRRFHGCFVPAAPNSPPNS
jgi:hypothetical protein